MGMVDKTYHILPRFIGEKDFKPYEMRIKKVQRMKALHLLLTLFRKDCGSNYRPTQADWSLEAMT